MVTTYDAMARPNSLTQQYQPPGVPDWFTRTWVSGVSYGIAGALLEYGAMSSSLTDILHHAAPGTPVLNHADNLRDNIAIFHFFLGQKPGDTAKPGQGRIPVSDVRGSGAAIDVAEGCYSIITAYQSSAGLASGALSLNTTGGFPTTWRVNKPMGTPKFAAGVESLLGAVDSANGNPLGNTFFGSTDWWYVSRRTL